MPWTGRWPTHLLRGTDLGFGSAFDRLVSSAGVLVPGALMRSFVSRLVLERTIGSQASVLFLVSFPDAL